MVIEMDKRNNRVVLSLGGNVGDVKKTLLKAISRLGDEIGEVELVSSLYRTSAWGITDQPDFLNQAISLNSKLSSTQVLASCLAIELELGRDRLNGEKWNKRIIDIDVLFYGDETIDTIDLIVPHPHIQDRNFVLYPLAEILPDYVHPIFMNTMRELKKRCEDKLQVTSILD